MNVVGPDLSVPAPRGQIVGGVYLAGTHQPVHSAMIKLEPTPGGRCSFVDDRYLFLTVSATFTVRVIPPDGYAMVGPDARQVTVPPGGPAEAGFYVRRTTCQFLLGFAAMHAELPTIVGPCLDKEQHNPANGDGLQHTINALLAWRKSENFAAFTDGYRTWVNGPVGVQERLNTQRFVWEANAAGLPVVQ